MDTTRRASSGTRICRLCTFVLLGLLLFLITSCSELRSGADANLEKSDSASADQEDRGDGADSDGWPLDAFLGTAEPRSDDDIVQLEEMELLIAQCMAAEGFEYWPIDMREIAEFSPDDVWGGLPYGSEEWIATFGFGVTTLVSIEAIEDEMTSVSNEQTLPEQERYLASLSDVELAAYQEALSGPPPTGDEAGGALEPQGCMSESYVAVFGDRAPDAQSVNELRFELYSRLQERIDADRRIIDDTTRAVACLESMGLGFATPDKLSAHLEQQAAMLEQTIFLSLTHRPTRISHSIESDDPAEGEIEVTTEIELVPSEDEAEFVLSEEELPAFVQEVQLEERELAAAYVECDVTALPVRASAAYREARTDIERRFIEENQVELGRLALD